MNFDLKAELLKIRKAGVPLVWIETVDPHATESQIVNMASSRALIHWDVAEGFVASNQEGQSAISDMIDAKFPERYCKPIEALLAAKASPDRSMLFFHNLQRFWGEAEVMQGLKNLRDELKSNGRTLFILGPSSSTIPSELTFDVKKIEEPYPSIEQLKDIVKEGFETLGEENGDKPDDELFEKAANALRGLPGYSAEQETWLALSDDDGFNVDKLGEQTRTVIGETRGLSVWRGLETFSDIGGCEQIKMFLTLVFNGKDKPLAIVWIDELDKVIGMEGFDTSGVSRDFLAILIQEMANTRANGILLLGPPGAGKSMTAKAAGGEVGVPTIHMDLGGMKDSLVGNSEANMRTAMRVIRSVSGGRVLYIATCNNVSNLPPELRSRFTLGTFYHDIPGSEEKAKIWETYKSKYPEVNFYAELLPETEGWTGREIYTCCHLADSLRIPLFEASKYIVPIALSARETIEKLRVEASGRYLSASNPGLFEFKGKTKTGRTMASDL